MEAFQQMQWKVLSSDFSIRRMDSSSTSEASKYFYNKQWLCCSFEKKRKEEAMECRSSSVWPKETESDSLSHHLLTFTCCPSLSFFHHDYSEYMQMSTYIALEIIGIMKHSLLIGETKKITKSFEKWNNSFESIQRYKATRNKRASSFHHLVSSNNSLETSLYGKMGTKGRNISWKEERNSKLNRSQGVSFQSRV